MRLQQSIVLQIFSFLIFSMGPGMLVWGQVNRSYQGPLQLGAHQGKATYQYQLIGQDTVLHGPFALQSVDLQALWSEGDAYLSLHGYFQEGLPDSTWQIQWGEHLTEEGAEFIDHHLRVEVSGVHHSAQLKLRGGQPQGQWFHVVQAIEASEVKQKIFESQVPFEDGQAKGIIQMKGNDAVMLGRFLPSGLAHDIWELNFDRAPGNIEQWSFVNGRLAWITMESEGRTDSMPVYGEEMGEAAWVDLDPRYFQILALQQVFDSAAYAAMGGKMQGLIAQNAAEYRRTQQLMGELDSLAQKPQWPAFKVKVASFPLSEQEQQYLDLLRSNLQHIDQQSRTLLQNTRLNILKHSDEDIRLWLAVIDTLAGPYLASAREVLHYDSLKVLGYLPRQALGLAPEWPGAIEVQVGDSIRVSHALRAGLPDPEVDTTTTLGYLATQSAYARQHLDSLRRQLSQQLKYQKLQQEYEELENSMLAAEDSLIALVDSLSRELENPYRQALLQVKAAAQASLRRYSETEDMLAKPELAQASIDCLAELRALALTIAQLPQRWQTLQELYTEQVWNPFTATTMQDEVKERIIEAYQQTLVPALLDSIQPQSACDEAERYQRTLDSLYLRMKQMRKENTSKLERKLKREDQPAVILKWFGISMQP